MEKVRKVNKTGLNYDHVVQISFMLEMMKPRLRFETVRKEVLEKRHT